MPILPAFGREPAKELLSLVPGIDQAEAVGADQPGPAAAAEIRQLPSSRAPSSPVSLKPAVIMTIGALGQGVLDHRQHMRFGDGDDDLIDGAGVIPEAG